ncbi:MAG: WD40 repeat domain-containing protein [Bacteroidetes bacterium]|nr:WD40 repeat domain-containing protein [Bacteroidota bacterium]
MKQLLLLCLSFVLPLSAQYAVEVSNSGGARHAGEQNHFSVTLTHNGTPVRTIEREIPFDVPFPSVRLHPVTGTLILSYSFDGFVEVYDRTGTKQWERNFFKELGPNYERTITMAVGERSLAFLTSDVRLPHAIVHKISVNGTEEWQQELPYGMGYEIAMSADERTIGAGSYAVQDGKVRRSALLLDGAGATIMESDILFRSAAFSEDGSMLAIASTDELAVLSVAAQKEIQRSASKTGGVIHGITWHQGSIVVQEAAVVQSADGVMRFTDPFILRFTPELQELERRSIPGHSYKKAQLMSTGTTVEQTADAGKVTVIEFR